MSRTELIARCARPAFGGAKDGRRWMLRALFVALALSACTDAPTAPSEKVAEAARPSLGVTLVPSGYSAPQVLGFLPGGNSSHANGINNTGKIVGWANRPVDGILRSRAFLYEGGLMQDLGTLPGLGLPGYESSVASDVNDAGHVVGTSSGSYASRAFRFTSDLGMENIHSHDNDQGNLQYMSWGEAINSNGTIVGYTVGGGYHAFRFTAAGGMQLLPGPHSGSEPQAYDINDAGIIVGAIYDGERAYVWPGSSGADIGTLGGSRATATAINNSAWIVGTSKTASGASHGFLWTWYWGLQDMGPLSDQYGATDISDKGRIIGNDHAVGKAYTFYQGKFSYLPGLISGGGTGASAINTCGTIVGSATDAAGRAVAVRWVRRTCDP